MMSNGGRKVTESSPSLQVELEISKLTSLRSPSASRLENRSWARHVSHKTRSVFKGETSRAKPLPAA